MTSPDQADSTPADLIPWSVLHLFAKLDATADASAIEAAIKSARAEEHQVITAALLGHKADLAVMALGPSEQVLRSLQSALSRAGCVLSYSYVSRTELSEYSSGLPEAMRVARLRPQLPPKDMPAFCFYPMSKKRVGEDNWYRLSFDDRKALMMGHGAIGRTFHGRVLQVITGSTGLDDFEWGVTLFGRTADDLKVCVYEMRFDEGSARYAEFGPFLFGTVGEVSDLFGELGLA